MNEIEPPNAPKVFISYSWTDEAHEKWVLELATRLRSDGVEIILDKWDLKEGHDKFAFMERMVTDPGIEKVLVICDRGYVTKADGRSGGVGTESQIISPEVYDKVDQEKFIPIVAERDDDGKPCVPALFKGRIYFDFSEPQRAQGEYEKLVRGLFGKPLHVRPPMGTPPAYVTAERQAILPSSSKARGFRDAVERERPHLRGLFRDYLEAVLETVERERLSDDELADYAKIDEPILASIERMKPLRTEFVETLRFAARYGVLSKLMGDVQEFFERLLTKAWHVPDRPWNDTYADNISFVTNEFFLLATVVLCDERAFGELGILLGSSYFPTRRHSGEISPLSFAAFDRYLRTLEEHRNQRLQLRRMSLTADVIRERVEGEGEDFNQVVDVDMILYVRSVLDWLGVEGADQLGDYWYPKTLVFMSHHHNRIFSRLRSRRFFESFKPVLGVDSIEELKEKVGRLPEGAVPVKLGFGNITSSSVASLLSLELIGTSP